MHGKICLVTGATSGIGRVTAAALANKGATLVVVGRDPDRTQATVAQLQHDTGNPAITGLIAELSSQEHIAHLVTAFRHRFARLDVLVNNAGAIFNKRQLSVDGIEMTFALNHLAYFCLTQRLLDVLKTSVPARIVNVASNAHHRGRIDFDNLQGARHYSGWRAYCQSKLANVLFTYQLAERLTGTGVSVNALHPGFVASNFGQNNRGFFALMVRLSMRFRAISPTEGAQTTIHLASSPDVDGITGKYFYNKQAVQSSPASYDTKVAQRLWQLSVELTDLRNGIA
jgi:NAD(P)-dependent dehydrogenase (short-subunit alcohol dehydrogenase family)